MVGCQPCDVAPVMLNHTVTLIGYPYDDVYIVWKNCRTSVVSLDGSA